MLIRIPTPGDVVGLAKSTVGWAVDSAAGVAAVPARAIGLVEGVETLLHRVNGVVDRAEELVERTSKTVDDAEVVLQQTRTAAASATTVIDEATRTSGEARRLIRESEDTCGAAAKTVEQVQRTAATTDELLESYAPLARRAAPMAQRFVEELSPKEVDAAIRLVDELPTMTEHILSDILPILRTLDRVGPEIHELLEVTHDVRRAIVGIPGFQFFRRRGDDRVAEQEAPKLDVPDSSSVSAERPRKK